MDQLQPIVDLIEDIRTAWLASVTSLPVVASLALAVLLAVADVARRGWRLSWSRRIVTSVLATVAIFHFNLVMAPLIGILAFGATTAYHGLGLPALPGSLWAGYPVWLLALLSIAVHDFADYWDHRLMHTRWVWPIHAIHHSDPDVNGLTAFRIHALEAFLMWGSYLLLLTWLGLPAEAIAVGAVLRSLHAVYVHMDADWDHGPLRFLVASPRFHRWHHADVKAAYGKNLASVMPLWDRLFGTYQVPGSWRDEPMGSRGVPEHDPVALMAFPFAQWGRMIARSARRLAGRPASAAGPRGGTLLGTALPTTARAHEA